MIYFILPIAIIVIGLGYAGWVIRRHIIDLKNLDVGTIPEEKENEVKNKILQAKLSRQSNQLKKKLSSIISPRQNFWLSKLTKIQDQIIALEEKYRHPKDHKEEPKTIPELFEEAEKFLKDDNFLSAEKSLIEIISLDNKNTEAYEKLGDMYFDNRNYDQAEEIFKYLLKMHTLKDRGYEKLGLIAVKKNHLEEAEMDFLSSLDINGKVANYYDDLAQVYEVTNKPEKALDCYLKATVIEPNNPKYLDKLIDLSIKIGDKTLAKKSFNHLREINPENGKLNDFLEAIEKLN